MIILTQTGCLIDDIGQTKQVLPNSTNKADCLIQKLTRKT